MELARPAKSGLTQALRFAAIFALVKLALQVGATIYTIHIGYGYFRDEFYYIMCGRFLDWGYVDQSPMVAVQARLATALFGHSIVGLRFFPALAGAARVFLTGLVAWSLGGRRPAQFLAMLAVIIAPCYIGGDGYLSMNSFESIFWIGCILTVIWIARDASPKWWLLVGVLAGLGLENKPSMTFFLVALVLGLLVTPQRRLLWNRWFAAAIALTVLIALPNLLWQMHNHWPTWEFLRNGKVENKNATVGPAAFILEQILTLHPLNVFVWGTGLIWLFVSPRAKGFRWIGATYIIFLAIMIALHAKDYYVIPIYPALFAAGGLAWEGTSTWSTTRVWRFSARVAILVITAALIFPMASPVLRPEPWIRYTQAMHLRSKQQENQTVGPLPQFYADRFGWQELADSVTRIYNSLPPEERAKAGILCSNYGEASAINFLATGVPFAISGHNNYYLWGPHRYTGEVMIVINGASLEEMRKYYDSVEIAGEMDNPYSMPYERRHIYLARGRKGNLSADWPDFKHYI
jgi:Dolichyl-phosphate-mannose-protein mannosyltransferase